MQSTRVPLSALQMNLTLVCWHHWEIVWFPIPISVFLAGLGQTSFSHKVREHPTLICHTAITVILSPATTVVTLFHKPSPAGLHLHPELYNSCAYQPGPHPKPLDCSSSLWHSASLSQTRLALLQHLHSQGAFEGVLRWLFKLPQESMPPKRSHWDTALWERQWFTPVNLPQF